MLDELRGNLPTLAGTPFADSRIERADDFSYTDPVDGSTTSKQGIRVFLEDGSRLVLRLSGTGTAGATLRIYLERFREDGGDGDLEVILAPLARAVRAFLKLRQRFGRS